MKYANLALLVAILLIGIANLLSSFGIVGGGGPSRSGGSGGDGGSAGHSWEYRVVNAIKMDEYGISAIAEELGVKPDEEGRMELPFERVEKSALLPRTLQEVEAEGWEFVSVTADHHYIFRRPK